MNAEDIMTRDPVTVNERATIGEAWRLLAEASVRHLPVVRDGDVVGILSDRDFRSLGVSLVADMETFERVRERLLAPVSALMTSGVVTAGRESDVSELVDLMLDEKLSAVPVVEDGTQELVGIVSYIDVLRAAQPLFENESEV
jgi:CBS-domain-containing membrane protein